MGSHIDPRLHQSSYPALPPPNPSPHVLGHSSSPYAGTPPARLPRIQPAPRDLPAISNPPPPAPPITSQQPPQPYYRHSLTHEPPYPSQQRPFDSPFQPAPPPPHDPSQDTYHVGLESPQLEPNADPNDPKRSRACEACRGLKVRCDQDPERPDQPCKRCAKAKRQCVVTAPSRKRQKKTDNRVAELEKKIDALTATLKAQSRDISSPDGTPTVSSPESTQHPGPNREAQRAVEGGQRRDDGEPEQNTRMPPMAARADSGGAQGPLKRRFSGEHSTGNSKKTRTSSFKPPITSNHRPSRSDTEDVINYIRIRVAEVIDEKTASQIFNRYVVEMAVHMPAVVFPPDTTAGQIRDTKPLLFLSILSVAAIGMTPVEMQHELRTLLMSSFAELITRLGEKRLEYIQALLIAVVWYIPPQKYEQMNFYQLTHIAAVMGIDLGMGKRVASHVRAQGIKDQASRVKAFQAIDTMEARRTWLGCYFMCANVSIFLRRPVLVRYSTYVDECIEVLESSPAALPTDKYLCQHIRLQHLNEQIHSRFSMDDPSAAVNICDPRIQDSIREFEQKLEDWRASVPEGMMSPALHYSEWISSLYMHEIAMHSNHNVDDFRAPFTEESIKAASGQQNVLSPDHGSALWQCVEAVHGIFNAFFAFDIPMVRALPIFYFVRIAYGVVVLIKLHFAINTPSSDMGKFIKREHLQVEYYIDRLLQMFRKIDAEDAFRPPNKFIMILEKLRGWFQVNKENKPVVEEDLKQSDRVKSAGSVDGVTNEMRPVDNNRTVPSTNGQHSQSGSQTVSQAHYDNSSALHFLSDVATTSSANSAASKAAVPPAATAASQQYVQQQEGQVPIKGQQRYAQEGWYSNMAAHTSNQGQSEVGVGMTDMTGMGAGFQEAMDMTLGMDADLSSLFMGDPLFQSFGAGMNSNDGMLYNQGWP